MTVDKAVCVVLSCLLIGIVGYAYGVKQGEVVQAGRIATHCKAAGAFVIGKYGYTCTRK